MLLATPVYSETQRLMSVECVSQDKIVIRTVGLINLELVIHNAMTATPVVKTALGQEQINAFHVLTSQEYSTSAISVLIVRLIT